LHDDDLSLKPKHVANNKIDINSVVIDGLYLTFTLYPISFPSLSFVYYHFLPDFITSAHDGNKVK